MAEDREREQKRQDWLRVLRRMEKVPDIVSDDAVRRVLAISIGEQADDSAQHQYGDATREQIGSTALMAFLDDASDGEFDEFIVGIADGSSDELARQATERLYLQSKFAYGQAVVPCLRRFLEEVSAYVRAHPFEIKEESQSDSPGITSTGFDREGA